MCSSPHWQVGLSWFREKLSPANREQRLSRWADFAKNCLPRIGSKELLRFREKYRALGRQKMGSNMRPRYIQFRDIRDRDISGLHCTKKFSHTTPLFNDLEILRLKQLHHVYMYKFYHEMLPDNFNLFVIQLYIFIYMIPKSNCVIMHLFHDCLKLLEIFGILV